MLLGFTLFAKRDKQVTYPYAVRDDFLSPAELSFYHILTKAVELKATVLTKVRLADIFFVKNPKENRPAFNRIALKHIDFLLCDSKTMRPILGIELDDGSHKTAKRSEKDEFFNHVFQAGELPLIRITAQRCYSLPDIAKLVAPYLDAQSSLPRSTRYDNTPIFEVSEQETDTPIPICAKCGAEMVLRVGGKGPHTGKPFWGCSNFPKCRTIQAA